MPHFISIYYSTYDVKGIRFDSATPTQRETSKRPSLLALLADSNARIALSYEDGGGFSKTLKSVYRQLVFNEKITEEVWLTIVGYGPFEFRTDLKRVSKKARAPAGGHDLDKIFGNELAKLSVRTNFQVVTDAQAVVTAGYWEMHAERYAELGPIKAHGQTVACLIGGIGLGGAVAGPYGEPIGSAHHSEFGHTRIHMDGSDDTPITICGQHQGCLQGMGCWAALEKRAQKFCDDNNIGSDEMEFLFANPDHEIWKMQAKYISQACQNFMFATPPERIILGGSMFELAPHLVDMVRDEVVTIGDEFLYFPTDQVDKFIVSRRLADEALIGGIHSGLRRAQTNHSV